MSVSVLKKTQCLFTCSVILFLMYLWVRDIKRKWEVFHLDSDVEDSLKKL